MNTESKSSPFDRAPAEGGLSIDVPGEQPPSTASTPRARWAADGEPDPHGTRYDCERAALYMGDLTDDELANGAFMNYDHFDIQKVIDRVPGYHLPIAWMTAVKDRIRWLSRALAKEQGLRYEAAEGTSASSVPNVLEGNSGGSREKP